MQQEVLDKDKTIADLNQQITKGEGGVAPVIAADPELQSKVDELEARLQEYEIIEDDIADLSLFKTENEKLKEEIERLKSQMGNSEPAAPAPEPVVEPEPVLSEPEAEPEAEPTENRIEAEPPEPKASLAQDLVAEFEKVVNSQADLMVGGNDESSVDAEAESKTPAEPPLEVVKSEDLLAPEAENMGSTTTVADSESDTGVSEASGDSVLVVGGEPTEQSGADLTRPLYEGIELDSKEEAEELIAELNATQKESE